MFANPIWSVLLLAVPVAVYFLIIRPRLKAKLTEIYGNKPWFQRWTARLYAFRTFAIATAGAIATAAPDILVALTPLDFSQILPQPWGLYVGTGVAITVALMKAFETKPGEKK